MDAPPVKGVAHAKSFALKKEVKHLQHSNTFAVKSRRGAEQSRISQSDAINEGAEGHAGRTASQTKKFNVGRTTSLATGQSSATGIGRTSSVGAIGGMALVSKEDMEQVRQVVAFHPNQTDSIELRYRILEQLALHRNVDLQWWPPTSEMKAIIEDGFRTTNSEFEDQAVGGSDSAPRLDPMNSMYRDVVIVQRMTTRKLEEAYEFAAHYEGDTELNLSHSKETIAKLLRAWAGGRCDMEALDQAFTYLPVKPTESQLRYLFFKMRGKVGNSGEGVYELSHERFVELYEELLVIQEGLRLSKMRELDKLFKFLDIRNSGYIKKTEILMRFPPEEKDLVSRQVDTLLNYYDADKNGRIDRKKFPKFYQGFLCLQAAYNLNDDRRLLEDWKRHAEAGTKRFLFSDVEFLSSAFHSMDVKKKLSISMYHVLFTLEAADGGAPSNDELEYLKSHHQHHRSFAHGHMDMHEFLQIHKDLKDARTRNTAAAKPAAVEVPEPKRKSYGRRESTFGAAIANATVGSQNAFFLRKADVRAEEIRSTRIQDGLLKRPADRKKSEISAIVSLLQISPDLHGVEGAALTKIAQNCGCGFFQAGQELLREGEESLQFWVVVSGSVTASVHSAHGEAQEMAEMRSGQCFGELALIFQQPRRCTVAASREGALVATVARDLFFQTGLAAHLRRQRYARLGRRMEVLQKLPLLAGRMDSEGLFALSHAFRERQVPAKGVIYDSSEDAVEAESAEDLRAEALPAGKLLFAVQQGACEVWARSSRDGAQVRVSTLQAASWFGGFASGRLVSRVTASAASAVTVLVLRVDEALARIPRETLGELLGLRKNQWRLAQLEAAGGVKSFLRRGGRPLKELQTLLQGVQGPEQRAWDADAAWSETSSVAPAGEGESMDKVVEVNAAGGASPLRVRLSSKPEVEAAPVALSDADVIHPLKSRWPIQNEFLLSHAKVNTRRIHHAIRRADDPAIIHYHHPRPSRPPSVPAPNAHWSEDMEYPPPVDVADPRRPLEREAQQKLWHAAQLYELQVQDGHPVHIDVYGNLMRGAALMAAEDAPQHTLTSSVSYSDAMAMFLAAREEHEKDRSAAALRKHAHSRISFALTPSDFFDILRQVADRLHVGLPQQVQHLADELKELHKPTLTAVIPSGIPRPKTAPLPDKEGHGVSTMLAHGASRPASSLTPYQRPGPADLHRHRPSSSHPAAPHSLHPSHPPPSQDAPAGGTPLAAVAAHYSFLRVGRTRSVYRALGHARLSLRSAGSIRSLQDSLYGKTPEPPFLKPPGPSHPAAVSRAMSHHPLLGPSDPSPADSSSSRPALLPSRASTPSSGPASSRIRARSALPRPAPLRPNSCPPEESRQRGGGADPGSGFGVESLGERQARGRLQGMALARGAG